MTSAEQAAAIDRAISRLVVADLYPLEGAELTRLAHDLAKIRHAVRDQPDGDLLTEGQWGLLAAAEHVLYSGRRHGYLGITDVVSRDESAPQAAMWGEAYSNASSQLDSADETALQLETARRVAAAQACLAFGEVPE